MKRPENEIAELDRLLASDKALRRKLIIEAGTDAGLREIALERVAQPVVSTTKKARPVLSARGLDCAAAAVILMGVMSWTEISRPRSHCHAAFG